MWNALSLRAAWRRCWAAHTLREEIRLELPASHRVPWEWFKAHACPAIRYRVARDVLPDEYRTPELTDSLYQDVLSYKAALALVKKQNAHGVWGGNLLGLQPLKSEGLRDVGTVAQYRRLLELGWHGDQRPLRLTERIFYRLLSRDEDPALFFEHRGPALKDAVFGARVRDLAREAAACALAEAGHGEDPRVRGAAHRIATTISQFLRGEWVEKPIARIKGRTVLHPEANPPSIFATSIFAHMPTLQRERAGFLQRLTTYLAQPAPRRQYSLQFGNRVLKPRYLLLGDPLLADASGQPKDIPLALHWIELLARIRGLAASPNAQRVLARLLRDCDERGIWQPRGLRSVPRAASRLSYHAFPLEVSTTSMEARQVDVTFRLALIARLGGLTLDVT